ncbi:hypothetical protein RN001_012317 [Aquatica leii]|uniref:Caspase-1 n=1 Tax=Aquatica leii TaxID=1421715 RepID=A0AAN7SPF6_9COLE|nr:hypothetical protein RN001_012317 [Aquatica leii]
MDTVDGNCIGSSKSDVKTVKQNRTFVSPSQDDKNTIYYNMNKKTTGLALIFNHEQFDSPKCPSRNGTNFDRSNLAIRLNGLGFHVKVFQDLSYNQLKKEIIAASGRDHSDYDCFIMVVLTHGDPGILYAKDRVYQYENLWVPFSDKNCPTLVGKPKLFFIQACQGTEADDGITLYRTEIDGQPANSHLILTEPDVLIAYSTAPGFYSWRRKDEGSWFINALCMELDKISEDYDLLTLLTFVNQRVALDYESNFPEDVKKHLKKQIPCITIEN